ncbi:unnamed protein product [Rhodiola kirilowii]
MHREGQTTVVPLQDSSGKRIERSRPNFRTFCSDLSFYGTFRNNFFDYLLQCASKVDNDSPVWLTKLYLPESPPVPLYAIEAVASCCKHCQIHGWGKHNVSKSNFHVIIPADIEWNKPLNENALQDQTHLLHAVVHCNGFGHLIRINGKESGSIILRGREIMDLWNRICKSLKVRKITVLDESKKRDMDIRLLNGIALGYSWFGRWGYRFHRGSFGVTEKEYDSAVEVLSSIQLDKVISDFSECTEIKQLIRYYTDLSEEVLLTIRDVLKFMLALKAATHFTSFSRYSGQSESTGAGPRFTHRGVYALKHMNEMVYSDIKIVYNVICSEKFQSAAQVKVVQHSKYFVKEWPVKDDGDHFLRFICQVKSPWLGDFEDEPSRRLQQQSGEVVVVIPPSSTLSHLKQAAQMEIRDTYCCLEQFVVTQIGGMENMKDDEEITSGAAESSSQVVVKGDGGDWGHELTFQASSEEGTVKCKCGVEDDDGEIMIQCEKCTQWMHTYCLQIDDSQINDEQTFFCDECKGGGACITMRIVS